MIDQIAITLRLDLLLQLAMAALLGGAIGLERELKGKPAGLRTNMLICTGATLFTALSLRISAAHGGDPARIAAQVLTGVGFIGAGTILHTRGAVTGLTSAATIWVVSAIGMALGARAYTEAFGTTALVMLVLSGLGVIERYISRKSAHSHLTIHARPEPGSFNSLIDVIQRTGVEVGSATHRQEGPDQVIELELRGPRRLHDETMIAVLHHPAVRSVSSGE